MQVLGFNATWALRRATLASVQTEKLRHKACMGALTLPQSHTFYGDAFSCPQVIDGRLGDASAMAAEREERGSCNFLMGFSF